jgi:hypothetical protein
MGKFTKNSFVNSFLEIGSKLGEYKRKRKAMKIRKAIHKDYLNSKGLLVVALLVGLTMVSCKNHHEEEYHSVTDKIKSESKHYDGISIASDKFIEELNLMEITEGGHTFLVPDRKSEIKSYACSECHTKPLSELKGKDIKKSHWNIKLKHANEDMMNCVTCHNGDDMDNLKSLTGKKIDFNNSYKLCSQCHTKQFEDWKGGAHGKRIGSWAPPRASLTCVNCHNPHKPGFDSRWPAKFNTQKVHERK